MTLHSVHLRAFFLPSPRRFSAILITTWLKRASISQHTWLSRRRPFCWNIIHHGEAMVDLYTGSWHTISHAGKMRQDGEADRENVKNTTQALARGAHRQQYKQIKGGKQIRRRRWGRNMGTSGEEMRNHSVLKMWWGQNTAPKILITSKRSLHQCFKL